MEPAVMESGMKGIDRLLQMTARIAVGVFFRDVEAAGRDRVPTEGPVLFVANHINSLVDPALLLARLPRRPRFLAKSTLWKNPVIGPFLVLAGAIPVYRRQDEGVDTNRNVETFARCHEVLATGGSIALFPEGLSHDEPQLQPLRTGVARIALEAERQHGPLGVRIVPVGLVFDEKQTFRSRALVLVGEPLDPLNGLDPAEGAAPEAVHQLTRRVARGLELVTPNYTSWRQADIVERASMLFSRPLSEDTRRSELANALPGHRAFRDGLDWFAANDPDAVAKVSDGIRRYDRLLEVAGLRDEQVAARYPKPVIIRYLARTLSAMLIWMPLALVGTALNWLPYRLVGMVADRTAPTPDTRATYKLFSALFLFPTAWILESVAAFLLAGIPAAAAAAVGAPLTGYAALRFHESRRDLAAEARAYLLLRSKRRAVTELLRRRDDLVDQIYDLVDRYEEAQVRHAKSGVPPFRPSEPRRRKEREGDAK
jgi:glycerol-3-phosphate O-acyltransferase/dihydroxyacetone phosphate acyltransferase